MWRVEAALLLECLGLYLQFNVIIHCKIGMSFCPSMYFTGRKTKWCNAWALRGKASQRVKCLCPAKGGDKGQESLSSQLLAENLISRFFSRRIGCNLLKIQTLRVYCGSQFVVKWAYVALYNRSGVIFEYIGRSTGLSVWGSHAENQSTFGSMKFNIVVLTVGLGWLQWIPKWKKHKAGR